MGHYCNVRLVGVDELLLLRYLHSQGDVLAAESFGFVPSGSGGKTGNADGIELLGINEKLRRKKKRGERVKILN